MTDSASDRLASLGAEALKGPWTWEAVGEHGYPQRIMANDDGYTLVAELFWGGVDTPNPDLELIVTLRNAAPEIEALVRAAEEEHHPVDIEPQDNDFTYTTGGRMCVECDVLWPCEVGAALDALNKKLSDA